MISKLHKIIAGGLILLLSGCYDDKGNYEYISTDELMPVRIEGLSEETIIVLANSLLEVKPQLVNDDPDRYTYLWYTIVSYSKEILSTERDLSVICNLPLGEYTLYYEVRDEERDIYKSVSLPFRVDATDIAGGWYLLKGINGTADVDYFALVEGKDRSNLLEEVVGIDPLAGTPVGMAYAPGGYNHQEETPDGIVTKTSAVLHIATNRDLISLNAADMTVFKTLEDEFYEKPFTINFQSIGTDEVINNTCYQIIINDNQLHTVGRGIGKIGYQLSGDYKIHPDILYGGSYTTWFYDQNSFKIYSTWGYRSERTSEMPDRMAPEPGEPIVFEKYQLEMIRLLPRTDLNVMSTAYCFCKSGIDGKYYLVSFGCMMDVMFYPSPTLLELPATSTLPEATNNVMAAPITGSVIYFASGNELRKQMVAAEGTESTVYTFPAGEKITYIKNFKDGTAFNDLVVATASASGYKIWRFPMVGSAGEIKVDNITPSMTGTGEIYSILYRNK
jgi:hypothetical protein